MASRWHLECLKLSPCASGVVAVNTINNAIIKMPVPKSMRAFALVWVSLFVIVDLPIDLSTLNLTLPKVTQICIIRGD